MRFKIVHICIFLMSFSTHLIAQSWPNVDYSYVRVGNYNLQSNLHGQHQAIKNGELDSTVLHFAPKLPEASVQSLLEIVNQKDQLLFDGLSKCFIPHHCFVFYNKSHQPVASISICFMCEQIDAYPKIDRKPVRRAKKSQISDAEKDLKALKTILLQAEDAEYHEIAFFDSPGGYKAYNAGMNPHPVIKGAFMDDFRGYNLSEFKDNNDFDVIDRIVENEEITAGGESYYFAELSFDDQEDQLSFQGSSGFNDTQLSGFTLTDSTLELGLPVRIGMTIEEVNRILIETSDLDVFSGMFYGQTKYPVIHIQDQDQSYFELKFYFENSVLTKIVSL